MLLRQISNERRIYMSRILVVIDMQNDFINGALGTEEAVKIVPKVVNKINNFDGEVIYTRDTHQECYLNTQEGHNLPVKHCIEYTEGWKLQQEIDALRIKKQSKIFDKVTFGSKELVVNLAALSLSNTIEEIVLVGLCTDICVISNALTLKTFLPEVLITVDEDCCAGVTVESHKNALNAMKMCHINIVK
jgi:Amidases related to nicotinamidase